MMSGRLRIPVGASERVGLFGNPTTTRTPPSSESFLRTSKENRGGGVPGAISQTQQQLGNSTATPYGVQSPGRRKPLSSPDNGSPIATESVQITPSGQSRIDNSPSEDIPENSYRSGVSSTEVVGKNGGGHGDGDDMLELEHIIGYTGHFSQTVIAHPRDNGVMIKSVGALLVIVDIVFPCNMNNDSASPGATGDPHQQHLLRGHDMEISALAVSSSGSLIATGQCGSTHSKGFPAPVIIWDYATKASLFVLQGLIESVYHLSFSPDQRFLLGCGGDRLVYVWNTSTGELVTGKQFSEASTLGEWTTVRFSGRRPVYQICLCIGKDVFALELTFDPARCQWVISGEPMATPSSGLRRHYHCSTLLAGGKFLLCGTDVGDMVVYGIDAKVFRASVPVCSGGVLSICTDHTTGAVYCGAGNGVVRKIVGADMVWKQELETRVDGGVVSLSVQADSCQLLIGTREGSIYQLLMADLSASKVSSSQKSPILGLACGLRFDVFATCAQDGTVRVWDLCDYGLVAEALKHPREAATSALCICWLGEEAVVTGWGDCFVRCHDAATGALRWEIPKAHRAPVTCCAAGFDSSAAFLVTGAEDGSVGVWELRTRELLLQFSEHQKGVRAVLIDVAFPNLVHSVGVDCTVLTYDLRKERRTVAHMTRAGAFQNMTQRLDSENELITCDVNGRLLMWDCDSRDPVQALQDPSHQRLTCVKVSPSGRYMVLGGDEQTIKVLDLANNCETVACGRAHAGVITSVKWTSDERQLVSAADDCTIAIWNFYGASVSPPSDRPRSHDEKG